MGNAVGAGNAVVREDHHDNPMPQPTLEDNYNDPMSEGRGRGDREGEGIDHHGPTYDSDVDQGTPATAASLQTNRHGDDSDSDSDSVTKPIQVVASEEKNLNEPHPSSRMNRQDGDEGASRPHPHPLRTNALDQVGREQLPTSTTSADVHNHNVNTIRSDRKRSRWKFKSLFKKKSSPNSPANAQVVAREIDIESGKLRVQSHQYEDSKLSPMDCASSHGGGVARGGGSETHNRGVGSTSNTHSQGGGGGGCERSDTAGGAGPIDQEIAHVTSDVKIPTIDDILDAATDLQSDQRDNDTGSQSDRPTSVSPSHRPEIPTPEGRLVSPVLGAEVSLAGEEERRSHGDENNNNHDDDRASGDSELFSDDVPVVTTLAEQNTISQTRVSSPPHASHVEATADEQEGGRTGEIVNVHLDSTTEVAVEEGASDCENRESDRRSNDAQNVDDNSSGNINANSRDSGNGNDSGGLGNNSETTIAINANTTPNDNNSDSEEPGVPSKRWKNRRFLCAFILCQLLVLAVTCVGISDIESFSNSTAFEAWKRLAVCSFGGSLVGAIFFNFAVFYTQTFLTKVAVLTLVSALCITVGALFAEQYFLVGLLAATSLFYLIWMVDKWDFISFSTKILEAAVVPLETFISGPICGYITSISLFSYSLLVHFSILSIYTNGDVPDVVRWIFVPIMICIEAWTMEMAKAGLQVAIASSVDCWYFEGSSIPELAPGTNATYYALARAFSQNLGTVSFAGAVVTPVRVLRYFLDRPSRWMMETGCGCEKTSELWAAWVSRKLQYVNEFGYIQIAVFGSSFWPASKASGRVVESNLEAETIRRLSRVGIVLQTGTLVCALGLTVVFGAWASGDWDEDLQYLCMFLTFLVNYYGCSVVFHMINGSITAIISCLSLDPDTLHLVSPSLEDLLAQVAFDPPQSRVPSLWCTRLWHKRMSKIRMKRRERREERAVEVERRRQLEVERIQMEAQQAARNIMDRGQVYGEGFGGVRLFSQQSPMPMQPVAPG